MRRLNMQYINFPEPFGPSGWSRFQGQVPNYILGNHPLTPTILFQKHFQGSIEEQGLRLSAI